MFASPQDPKKIIQITSTQNSLGYPVLFALDNEGNIWQTQNPGPHNSPKDWELIKNPHSTRL